MSQSRSTSPTPITFSALTSPVSTTPVQLPSPSELTLSKESQSPQFTATYPLPHATQSNPLDSRDLDSPMARQLRIQQTIASPSREHSTLSYSQDYVTSISKGSKGKRPSEPPGPSPKKKRTRTLTTPHQAAVLHALLAKSRFPNATVREEVGKSIGLSARKYDPSRILPPLVFPPPIPRPTLSAPASSGAAFDPLHQAERRSLTPVDIISYQPPESAASVTWPHPSVIHPQLQQPASFESAYQSSRSPPPWAVHDHGTASKSVIPPVLDTEKPPSSDVTAAAVRPPERSRRYDPIRGTFIYSSPPEEH
ncbi:hypothetical protein C0993_010473 [Termitomyces sp. T159_Od127]|nr:hypothetical protein C0993_010473 [Termitomyces sp. T159_Od127]